MQHREKTSPVSDDLRLIIAITLIFTVASINFAFAEPKQDNWQFSVGAYLWAQDFQGDANYTSLPVDESRALGYDKFEERGLITTVGIEHSHWLWLPQLRLQHSEVSIDHQETFSSGGLIPTEVDLDANTDLDHSDAILFYRLLDQKFRLELGTTIRHLDGEINITDGTNSGRLDLSETAPLVFGAGRYKIAFDELGYVFIGGEAMGLEYRNISHLDYRISAGVHTPEGLRFEAGARKFELDYDDADDSANISVKGFFAGIAWHF